MRTALIYNFLIEANNRVSTDSEGIAKSLGLNAQPKIELEEMIATIEQKLSDDYRLKI